MNPASLIAAQLGAAGSRLEAKFGCDVSHLAFRDGTWSACDRRRKPIAQAPVAVLANADASALLPSSSTRVRRVRGQISFLPEERFVAPHVVVLRGGFVLPAIRGSSIAGASYDFDDEDASPRTSSHAGNLERLERIVPGAAAGIDPSTLEGIVGFRAVSPDRLPLIGWIADEDADAPKNPLLATLGRCPGLFGAFAYGSRGLLWSGIGGELVASLLEGEPLPLEGRLADALNPGRFFLRFRRKRAFA